jgi:hypothetical protein
MGRKSRAFRIAAAGSFVGSVLLVATHASSAQMASSSPERSVLMRSTAPVVRNCRSWTAGGCFRLLLEISGTRDQPVQIGYSLREGLMEHSHAYLPSGISCVASMVSGVAVNYSNREWTAVGRTTPARAIVAFGCDGPIKAGDEVLVDLTFWVSEGGRRGNAERFAFPQRPLE